MAVLLGQGMIGRLMEEARGPGQSFSISSERQTIGAEKDRWETRRPFGGKGDELRYVRST